MLASFSDCWGFCRRLKADVPPQAQAIKDSLVVYKNEPAIVDDVNEELAKVTLTFLGSKARKAKLKDVAMIYEGPVRSWEVEELNSASPKPVNSVEEVHELVLETGSKSISELAQLLFDVSRFHNPPSLVNSLRRK